MGFRRGSVFQGWFTNPLATLQQFCIVPAEITALVSLHWAAVENKCTQLHVLRSPRISLSIRRRPYLLDWLRSFLLFTINIRVTLRHCVISRYGKRAGTQSSPESQRSLSVALRPLDSTVRPYLIRGLPYTHVSRTGIAIQIAKLAGFSPIIATPVLSIVLTPSHQPNLIAIQLS